MNYFTEKEIEEIKKGSLSIFTTTYSGTNKKNIVEVTEVVSISGMADNNGIPTEIKMYVHRKGEAKKELTYKLIKQI